MSNEINNKLFFKKVMKVSFPHLFQREVIDEYGESELQKTDNSLNFYKNYRNNMTKEEFANFVMLYALEHTFISAKYLNDDDRYTEFSKRKIDNFCFIVAEHYCKKMNNTISVLKTLNMQAEAERVEKELNETLSLRSYMRHDRLEELFAETLYEWDDESENVLDIKPIFNKEHIEIEIDPIFDEFDEI